MGRHRSTLRELGWGVSNSPNPWKQGSAKRVVRTLDYSAAEVDDPPVAEPLPDSQQAGGLDDKLAQMQHDGRQQLDRIREQFEQQEAESKRKLDRLNGRIAELGEGKRAMWSAIGQGQKAGGKAEAESAAAAPTGTSADADVAGAAQQQTAEGALARREAELSTKETEISLIREACDKVGSVKCVVVCGCVRVRVIAPDYLTTRTHTGQEGLG